VNILHALPTNQLMARRQMDWKFFVTPPFQTQAQPLIAQSV